MYGNRVVHPRDKGPGTNTGQSVLESKAGTGGLSGPTIATTQNPSTKEEEHGVDHPRETFLISERIAEGLAVRSTPVELTAFALEAEAEADVAKDLCLLSAPLEATITQHHTLRLVA